MPTKTKDNETYLLVTTNELTALGFFKKQDEHSWFLYPSKVKEKTFDFTGYKTSQTKSFDNMNHIHLITIDLGDGDEACVKSKSKATPPKEAGGSSAIAEPGSSA